MKVFRGGVRIGRSYWDAWNCSWPFAKLIFRDDALVISTRFLWKREYTLRYGTITAAERKRWFLCSGVAITHRAPEVPPFIVFWTVKAASVLEEFRKHGIRM